MNANKSNAVIAADIKEVLLPGASSSRTRMLDRTLGSLTPAQMQMVERAVTVAVAGSGKNFICDAIESRDMMTLAATARWERIIRLSPLEQTLNAQFSEGDKTYDVYSPEFEAHVEAYATYHDHCGPCFSHDRDREDGYPVPDNAHYFTYLQDYELMDAVQEHPDRVTELVRLAGQRGGLKPEVLDEYLASDQKSLAEGIL